MTIRTKQLAARNKEFVMASAYISHEGSFLPSQVMRKLIDSCIQLNKLLIGCDANTHNWCGEAETPTVEIDQEVNTDEGLCTYRRPTTAPPARFGHPWANSSREELGS